MSAKKKPARLPMQPIQIDSEGTVRFRGNAIVEWLRRSGRLNLNDVVTMHFPQEDVDQFWQLLGYPIAGYEELSFIGGNAVVEAKQKAKKTLGWIYKKGVR